MSRHDDEMADVLSNVLGNKPPKLNKSSRSHTVTALMMGLLLIVVIVGVLIAVKTLRQQPVKNIGPIPTAVVSAASYEIYYPSKLPADFTLNSDSINNNDGVLFYTLSNGNETISISEQTLPNPLPSVKNIQNNTSVQELDTKAGHATIGTYGGVATAFIIGKTTMMNLTGTKGVTTDQLTQVARSMTVQK